MFYAAFVVNFANIGCPIFRFSTAFRANFPRRYLYIKEKTAKPSFLFSLFRSGRPFRRARRRSKGVLPVLMREVTNLDNGSSDKQGGNGRE